MRSTQFADSDDMSAVFREHNEAVRQQKQEARDRRVRYFEEEFVFERHYAGCPFARTEQLTKEERVTSEKFESWAIVELFGHQRMAGLCTAVDIGGASFVRIDVPDVEKDADAPAKLSRLVNPTAIYSITPVTEETARAAAKSCSSAPVTHWDVRELVDREVKAAKERVRALPGEYRSEDEDYGDSEDDR